MARLTSLISRIYPNRSLIRLFSASQAPKIQKIGVIGLGLMGHGIAQVSAASGFNVVAVDSSEAAVASGMGMIKKSVEAIRARAVAKGALPDAAKKTHDDTLSRIETSTSRGALKDCDLVIEAVPETMAIKTPIYQDLARILRPDAIIASNTSGLQVSAMADIAGRRTSTVGAHYFNPVQIMQLVEVVRLPETPQSVIDAVVNVVRRQGKTPVVCEDTPGFIVNALLVPYLASAIRLLDKGVAGVEEIDTAMKLGAGHPMGPLHLADYVGLDTTHHILSNWAKDFPNDPAFTIPASLEAKVKAGDFGRKTGQGYYKWKGNSIVS